MGLQDTNFEITGTELLAMQDTSFFEMKWKVMEKISSLLAELQTDIERNKPVVEHLLPEVVFSQAGKISKGENYLGFPYQVLDFPRIFEKENIFAFRSMFWWGKHFSFTLHVGGIYYEESKHNFIRHFDSLRIPGVFVCVNKDPWEYHFEESNFTPAMHFNPALFIEKRPYDEDFIKLSFRTEIKDWNNIRKDGMFAFLLFCKTLYSDWKTD